MPRFQIIGAERDSGRDVLYVVSATDEEHARNQAAAMGHLVSRVKQVSEPDYQAIAARGGAGMSPIYPRRQTERSVSMAATVAVGLFACAAGALVGSVLGFRVGAQSAATRPTTSAVLVPPALARPVRTPDQAKAAEWELVSRRENARLELKAMRDMLRSFSGMDPAIRANVYVTAAQVRERAKQVLTAAEVEELFPADLIPPAQDSP